MDFSIFFSIFIPILYYEKAVLNDVDTHKSLNVPNVWADWS